LPLSTDKNKANHQGHEQIFILDKTLKSDLPIDLILLQETWEIKYPNTVSIPGFQNIVFRSRTGMRGGGVGIYLRNGLKFKERKDL
jgi:hypothetical protein